MAQDHVGRLLRRSWKTGKDKRDELWDDGRSRSRIIEAPYQPIYA
ncbi:hypothetical protein [Oxynema sp. CENA135]|nr:hypothetical protein [Oxynema sp. CENA135]